MRLLFASLLALCSLPVFAQPVNVQTITFTGAPDYDRTALAKISGLKSGPTDGDQIRAGAQKLNETGLFSNVNFKFDGQTVTYELTPSQQLLTAVFDNFVWLTPEEIDRGLRARIPLYTGSVPAQGAFAASVADALMRILKNKSVTATVTFHPESVAGAAPSTMRFRVSAPAVKLRAVTVKGATPDIEEKLGPVLLAAAEKHDYSETASREYVAATINNVAFENGYMEERLTGFEHTAPVPMGTYVNVDVVATIDPGPQYHVSEVNWAGSPLLSKESFDKLNPLKPGGLASQQKLLRAVQTVGGYYYRSGYMNAKVDIAPVFDRGNKTVAYTISAEPGEQFRLASVQFLKLTPTQEEAVRKAWTMNPGDRYDSTYVTSFLHNNRDALTSVLPNYGATYKETADHDSHTVELEVIFAPFTFGH